VAGLTRAGPSAPVAGESALLALALFGAGSAASETASLSAFVVLGAFAWFSSRPGLAAAIRDLRFLLTIGLVLFAFQALGLEAGSLTIDPDGTRSALRALARIAGGYGAARAFYAALGISRIRDALARFARPFPQSVREVFDSLALAICFVPAVLAAWDATEEAARARGFKGRVAPGNRRGVARSLRMLSATVVAFLRNLLLLSRDVAEARAARRSGEIPRSLPPFEAGIADLAVVALSATPLALSLLY
jgi:energy-coupling factor transporter transmembrane protein EcfT